MPRIPGTTNEQSAFLRAILKNPDGPPAELWPRPAIWRRWIKRDTFRAAMDSLRDALQYETDLHLAYAARNAARAMNIASASSSKSEDRPETPADAAPLDPSQSKIETQKSTIPTPKPADSIRVQSVTPAPPEPQNAAPIPPQSKIETQKSKAPHTESPHRRCLDILKLVHLRQRFPAKLTTIHRRPHSDGLGLLRRLARNITLGVALDFHDELMADSVAEDAQVARSARQRMNAVGLAIPNP